MYDLSTGPVFSFMLTTYFFVSLETVLPGPNFLKHVYVGSSYTEIYSKLNLKKMIYVKLPKLG